LNVETHRLIERLCKLIASAPPVTNSLEAENLRAENSQIEVLMGDGVSPGTELLQSDLTPFIPQVKAVHILPEYEPEPVVIRTDVAGIRIASVQFPAFNQ